MKKIFTLGLSLLSLVLLTACGNSENSLEKDQSEDASGKTNLQQTVDSLTEENSKLKSENTELSERVETFEKLFEGFPSSEEVSSDNDSTSYFKIGESASFTSSEKITVTEVRADDSITLSNPKEGEHPVIVTAVVENVSNEPIDFNAQTFDLYDGNSELANFDASTYSNNIPHSIAGGKKATIVMHFSSKGNAPYSITYGPATWDE